MALVLNITRAFLFYIYMIENLECTKLESYTNLSNRNKVQGTDQMLRELHEMYIRIAKNNRLTANLQKLLASAMEMPPYPEEEK